MAQFSLYIAIESGTPLGSFSQARARERAIGWAIVSESPEEQVSTSGEQKSSEKSGASKLAETEHPREQMEQRPSETANERAVHYRG